MRCQERLREHVVEGEYPQERDDNRLVHSSTHAFGAAGRSHALVTGDDGDDGSEEGRLDDGPPEVSGTRIRQQGREERTQRRLEGESGQNAPEDAEHEGVDVEEARHDHEGEESWDDEVLDRVDAQHLEGVQLLADLAGAEVGRDGRARHAGEDDRGHERRELADRRQDEEPAQAVDRTEEDEEVARLQTRSAVAERDRRDQQREPAEAQREQELLDELRAVRIRRPDGRHDGLAGQDHHVPDLLQQVLGGQESPIGYCSDQLLPLSEHRRVRDLRKRTQPTNVVPLMKLVHTRLQHLYDSPALRSGTVAISLIGATALVAGCGGGGERQDANEPSGDYKVQVVEAKFPQRQALAKRSTMMITVKNVDSKTIPNIAVTVKSFDQTKNDPTLADPRRPQFIVNTGPHGGDTAYVGTSALGPLKPGETKTFKWDVTAVVAGPYSLKYAVAAGLNGRARAVPAGGGARRGEFRGRISPRAPQAKVADDGHTVVTTGG